MAGKRATKASLVKLQGQRERLLLAAMGIEAGFTVVLKSRPRRHVPVFGDVRGLLGAELMHRVGTSYHLSTGGAVYFDTGVIEIATPAMEIEKGCAARAGRSLWEGILECRSALDKWQRDTGRDASLVGFS